MTNYIEAMDRKTGTRLTGRAVRERLKGKVDPEVLFVCESLAEYQGVLYQQGMELAQLVDKITDIVMQFTTVAENMKNAVESMGKYGDGDEEG